MTTEATTKPAEFEAVTCSRCGGTGNYSYCQTYGTRCFKCRGAKRIYTKRGAAAAAFFNRLLSLPLKELQPGMVVRQDSITMSGTSFREWATVVGVRPGTLDDGCMIINGERTPYAFVLHTRTKSGREGSHHLFNGEELFRVAASKEKKAEAFAAALAYQATLTKQGKPRRRGAAA